MIGDTNVRAMPVAVGTQISTLEVGTLVKMNLDGAPWEWRIVHQGLPGSMYDASCDGCWLLLENIYTQILWSSRKPNGYNDYQNSDVFGLLQNDFFSMLDSGIQRQVKQVKIPYVNGISSEGSVSSGANGLSCKLFLLSGYEVGLTTSEDPDFPIDGVKLSYFDSGYSSTATNKRIATWDGSATEWWLRSPDMGWPYAAFCVLPGGRAESMNCSDWLGIRPALILPSSALVDDDLNVLAA